MKCVEEAKGYLTAVYGTSVTRYIVLWAQMSFSITDGGIACFFCIFYSEDICERVN